MKFAIIRHGEAHSANDDSSRTLTQKGIEDIRRQAMLLCSTQWSIHEIRTSPLRRAVQTGMVLRETIKERTGLEIPLVQDPALSPGLQIPTVIHNLDNCPQSAAIVWVFHAPEVAEMASYFLSMPPESLYFQPGTSLAMNLPPKASPGSGMLIWTMQPDMLAYYQK